MLGNCRQTLIKQKFHQPNELAFIRCQLEVASSKGATQVGEASSTLMQNGTKHRTRRVAVHHEGFRRSWASGELGP